MSRNGIDAFITDIGSAPEYSPFDDYVKTDLEKRILVINDNISELMVERHAMCILRWNAEDKDLPVDKRKVITVYINSIGGSSFDGQAIIDVMLASKTKVRTVCLGMAASMAYLIFIAGSERIAFPNSSFLMHEGETGVSGVASKARETMDFLDVVEKRTKDYILNRTAITEDFYNSVYKKEYWMFSQEAQKLNIVDKIIGEDADLDILFN